MANTYKNIVITPNRDSDAANVPNIRFSGGDATTNTDITLRVYTASNGTLSFEGSAGQLFSITNDLTGSIFSVNDVSGIPSIDVNDDGRIALAPYSGNVVINRTTDSTVGSAVKLDVNGAVNATALIVTGNVNFDTMSATKIVEPAANTLAFHTTQAERMRIDASGNVGIGTTSPRSIFDVTGTGSISQRNWVYLTGGNVGGGQNPVNHSVGFAFGQNYSGGSSESNFVWGQTVGSQQYLSIAKWTGSAVVEQMRITSGGNVGVGTTNPLTLLDVNGTANVSSNLTMGGGINFGSSGVASPQNLSRHLNLWGGTYGMSITGSQQNYVVDATGNHVLHTGTTERARVNATGLHVVNGIFTNGNIRANAFITVTPQNGTAEGGEISIIGAGAYDNWSIDSYVNELRFLTSSSNTNTFRIYNYGAGTVNMDIDGNITTAGSMSAASLAGSAATGSGASGTWGISITGSAGSATTATTATNAINPTFSGDSVDKANITTRTESGIYQYSLANTALGWPTDSGGWHHLISATHSNDANYYAMQIAARFDTQNWYFRNTNGIGTTAWSTMLHSGNYTNYSPTLTGTGASGTWSINVTGNAGTATTLQTARNINGTSFNGSAAITTASWGTARNITIGSTTKSVDGSAAVSWSLTEIGAPSTTGTGASGSWGISVTGSAATFTSTTQNSQFNSIGVNTAAPGTAGEIRASSFRVGTTSISPLGQHAIWVPAVSMYSRTTAGAIVGTLETATNDVMIRTFNFDTTTQEFVQFAIQMPKSWNESTLICQFIWSHPATTTNFGVVWQIQAVAFGDTNALDTAFGTAVTATDTGGTTDALYISPETAAMTVAGSPAAEEYVIFQVARVPANASDTLAVDARLHGVKIHYTTNEATDD